MPVHFKADAVTITDMEDALIAPSALQPQR